MSDPPSPASGTTLLPSTKSRMLVICFDGTTNHFDGNNTNVVKLFAMLKKDCEDEQLCYYQTGIGTYTPPSFMTHTKIAKIMQKAAEMVDMGIALYLDMHVMGGYNFLMKNYRNGDNISIFGFSRGAYTARALAGMLTKVGLLPKDNIEQVPFAWKMYSSPKYDSLAAGFKQTFCRSVEIEFLGVWDTVASTGILYSRDLPFTRNSDLIKTFRHAMSLDEHRAKFVPTFWQLPVPTATASGPSKATSRMKLFNPFSFLKRTASNLSDVITEAILDPDYEEDESMTSDVKEVWFAGSHSDVGGGAQRNDNQATLADITLRWMVREIVASQCGIQFEPSMMEQYNVYVDLSPKDYFSHSLAMGNAKTSCAAAKSSSVQSVPSAQDQAMDKVDATTAATDDLFNSPLAPFWWLLEVIPFVFSWQDSCGRWHSRWKPHLGEGRFMNHTSPLYFHETVKIRMDDAMLKYKPKLHYPKGKEEYAW